MAQRVLPFLKPSNTVVRAAEWLLAVDGDEMPLPESYPNWDYQTHLRLRRSLQIDRERALAESRLAPDADLILAVVWTSTGSRLRGTAMRVIVPESGAVELRAELSGSELGGVLQLDTVLALSRRRHGTDRPVAPRRAGSVMWSDRSQIRLQGDAPQFPIAIIDFAKTNYPNNAAWHLEIGTNLEAATMGSLLLLVNERHTMITEALRRAGNPSSQEKFVLALLHADVARTMVDFALRHTEFEDIDYPDETIGATLHELLGRIFPERSLTDIRLRAEHSPNLFASELQDAVKIFEGVI